METSIRVPAIGTFDQAVTPLSTFWVMVLHDTPHKPTAALRRFAADFECQIVFECSCQHCSTLRFFCGLMHLSVPSPSFPTWELSVTEYQCQSVFRSAVPLGR